MMCLRSIPVHHFSGRYYRQCTYSQHRYNRSYLSHLLHTHLTPCHIYPVGLPVSFLQDRVPLWLTPSSLHLSKLFYILPLSANACTPCLSCLSCPFSSPDLSSPLDSQSSYLWGGSPDPSNFKVYRLRTNLTAKRKWWKSKRSGDAQLVPGWSSTPKFSLIAPLLRTLH